MRTDKKTPGSPLGDETGGLYTKGLRFFLGEEAIDLIDKFVAIHTVNHAGLLNGLASCRRAAQAMHADFKEEAVSTSICSTSVIIISLVTIFAMFTIPFSRSRDSNYI